MVHLFFRLFILWESCYHYSRTAHRWCQPWTGPTKTDNGGQGGGWGHLSAVCVIITNHSACQCGAQTKVSGREREGERMCKHERIRLLPALVVHWVTVGMLQVLVSHLSVVFNTAVLWWHLHVTDSLIHLLLPPVSLQASFYLSFWLKSSSEVVKQVFQYWGLLTDTHTHFTMRQHGCMSMLLLATHCCLTCQADHCRYGQLSLKSTQCISNIFSLFFHWGERCVVVRSKYAEKFWLPHGLS